MLGNYRLLFAFLVSMMVPNFGGRFRTFPKIGKNTFDYPWRPQYYKVKIISVSVSIAFWRALEYFLRFSLRLLGAEITGGYRKTQHSSSNGKWRVSSGQVLTLFVPASVHDWLAVKTSMQRIYQIKWLDRRPGQRHCTLSHAITTANVWAQEHA